MSGDQRIARLEAVAEAAREALRQIEQLTRADERLTRIHEIARAALSEVPFVQEGTPVTDEMVERVLDHFYGCTDHHRIERDGMRAALEAAWSVQEETS